MDCNENINLFQPTGFRVVINRKHYKHIQFYVQSVNHYLNKHFFTMHRHPKLQWLMATAASPREVAREKGMQYLLTIQHCVWQLHMVCVEKRRR